MGGGSTYVHKGHLGTTASCCHGAMRCSAAEYAMKDGR